MTNVEKLESIGKLGDVRQRMGAENEDSTTCDERINKAKPAVLVAKWCGWNLGDEDWWWIMLRMYDELRED